MERNLKETLQKLWTCTKWNLKKNARNHQDIQRKPWRNPWWTGQRRIVKLGDRIAKCGEWILKLGLWHLEVVFWNLQVVLWNLHCETGKSYCETLPGGLWNSNTRLWNSEEAIRSWNSLLGFWKSMQEKLISCRKQQKVSIRSPSATGRGWHLHAMSKLKKKKPYCTHSRSISILVGVRILISSYLQLYTLNIKFKCHEVGICITFSLPLYTFKVNRVGNFDIF